MDPHKWKWASSLKKNNSVLRNDFQKNLTCVPPRIEVMFRKFLHNRHLVWMEMKIIMKNSPHRMIGESRADACLRAECCGDRNIEALTASMFSGDLIGWETPVLRLVALAVCLNVVTHVTIDFWAGTGANGAKLKRFRKAHWVGITDIHSRSRPQWQTHAPHCSNAWWRLNCAGTKLYSPASRTRPLALRYDINQLNGTHFKKGSYAAAPCIWAFPMDICYRDFYYIFSHS